ncbi:MAG: GNAT family N-acetyltransferase [Sphingomonadaceae bacterium]
MTGVSIAHGTAEDLAAIMPVMTSAFDGQFGEAWTAPQCLGLLSMPGSRLLLAYRGAAVGFALARTVVDETELMLLAVAPPMRRRGIGQALLAAVIADSVQVAAKSIHLEVREGNPAVRLYTSTGFVEVGRRPRYYQGSSGQTFDALTLLRTLA